MSAPRIRCKTFVIDPCTLRVMAFTKAFKEHRTAADIIAQDVGDDLRDCQAIVEHWRRNGVPAPVTPSPEEE